MEHIYLIGDSEWITEFDQSPLGYIDSVAIFEDDSTELCCLLSDKPDPNKSTWETPF